MSVFLNILFLAVGFVLLVKGADIFVNGSSSIAKLLRIPSLIIGLTIVAFGTSAPEASVSIIAGIGGNNDIAVANVVGSNIFNSLFILGVCALIRPLGVHPSLIKREMPFNFLGSAILLALTFDVMFLGYGSDMLSRGDGVVLLLVFCVFLYAVIGSALKNRTAMAEGVVGEKTMKPWLAVVFTILGLAGVIVGGKFVVDTAVNLAGMIGISQNIIGLTIISIGTSLPELVTSIIATKKGDTDIAIGNVVGSNIFNIFFILGLSSVISPIAVSALALIDIVVALAVCVIVFVVSASGKRINRIEGGVMLALYIAYIVYACLR